MPGWRNAHWRERKVECNQAAGHWAPASRYAREKEEKPKVACLDINEAWLQRECPPQAVPASGGSYRAECALLWPDSAIWPRAN